MALLRGGPYSGYAPRPFNMVYKGTLRATALSFHLAPSPSPPHSYSNCPSLTSYAHIYPFVLTDVWYACHTVWRQIPTTHPPLSTALCLLRRATWSEQLPIVHTKYVLTSPRNFWGLTRAFSYTPHLGIANTPHIQRPSPGLSPLPRVSDLSVHSSPKLTAR